MSHTAALPPVGGSLVDSIKHAEAAARAAGLVADADAQAAKEAEQAASVKQFWPQQWLDCGFVARAERLGLRLYAEQLAQITIGELQPTAAYKRFCADWSSHAPAPGRTRAALMSGGMGTGKSIMALWACLQAQLRRQSWEWLEVARLAEVYARGHWQTVDRLRAADLVVWDELGDAEDIKGHVWATFKEVLNTRYRARKDQILVAIPKLEVLQRQVLGEEIVDRIPPELRFDAGDGSLRWERTNDR